MYQISAARRAASLGLAVGCSAVLLLSCWVSPDPVGLGTHVQLGLPPCIFWSLTGWPCPTCGLTTSFAHMARMQPALAFHAHGLGPLLFMLTAFVIPCALLVACARESRTSHARARAFIATRVRRIHEGRFATIAALTLMAALLVAWLARLARF